MLLCKSISHGPLLYRPQLTRGQNVLVVLYYVQNHLNSYYGQGPSHYFAITFLHELHVSLLVSTLSEIRECGTLL